MSRRWLLALLAALAVVAGFLFTHQLSPKQSASALAGNLTDIQRIETLRDDFNRDGGQTRLILLVSPT
jgi:hypothetical protein